MTFKTVDHSSTLALVHETGVTKLRRILDRHAAKAARDDDSATLVVASEAKQSPAPKVESISYVVKKNLLNR